ncbi:hypothetical protein [Klebsiella quasivariicola]|uniref:hypothetical protein n=1 Tax=Klebsiella quasivariicola TaxID=2026240 RepID=UPI002478655F|nr:hypothetical protein [Klebsiella quasivariicola]
MKWILENGYYVNTETGECENKEQYESAVEFLTYSTGEITEPVCLTDSLTYSTGEISHTRKRASGGGRKPVTILNPYSDALQGYKSFNDIPHWLDDVISGSGNNHQSDNTRISPRLVFHLLRCMSTITTGEIRNHINDKRAITTQDIVSTSYCEKVRNSLVSAIHAIEHQLRNGKDFYTPDYDDFDFDVDAWNYEHYSHPEQSEQAYQDKLMQVYTVTGFIHSCLILPSLTTGEIRIVGDAHSGMMEVIKINPRKFKEAFDALSSEGSYLINDITFKIAA